MGSEVNDESGEQLSHDDAEAGGFVFHHGKAHSPRTESGLTAIKEQRLLKKALQGNWNGRRWNTDVTATELLQKSKERGELTLKETLEAAVLTDAALTLPNVGTTDPRAAAAIQLGYRKLRQMAVKNGIMMEAQNQADQLAELRANAGLDAAAALSRAAAEAIVQQCVDAVRMLDGEEKANKIMVMMKDAITDDVMKGTTITPDMEAAAMDATIPRSPEEDRSGE